MSVVGRTHNISYVADGRLMKSKIHFSPVIECLEQLLGEWHTHSDPSGNPPPSKMFRENGYSTLMRPSEPSSNACQVRTTASKRCHSKNFMLLYLFASGCFELSQCLSFLCEAGSILILRTGSRAPRSPSHHHTRYYAPFTNPLHHSNLKWKLELLLSH